MEAHEAHTPKHQAIQRFLQHESGTLKNWTIRVADEPHDPIVRLNAWRDDRVETHPEKTLEVHTRQVRLADDEPDEATKTMIRRWIASL